MKELNIEIPDERGYLYDDHDLRIVRTDPENRHWPRWKERYRKCIKLADYRGGKWLDVACGSGYGTELISEVADNVIGMDIDTKTIEYARKHHRTRQNIEFVNRNILDFSTLDDNCFDVIISIETIEHLSDGESFLNSIYQLLRPGGKLVIATPESQSGGGKNPYNKFHLNEYTLNQFREVLSLFFSEVEIETEKAIFTTGLETVQMYATCKKRTL